MRYKADFYIFKSYVLYCNGSNSQTQKEFLPPYFGYGIAVTSALPQICLPPVCSVVDQYPVHSLACDLNIYKGLKKALNDYGLITVEDHSL